MVDAKNIMRGLVRSQQISSCLLTEDDFKQLYSLLSEKAVEAAELAIEEFKEKSHTLPQQDRDYFQARIGDATKLVAYLTGARGERVIYTEKSAISSESLPDDVRTLGIGSSYAYKVAFNTEPSNKFEVKLEFSKPKLLDFSNLWSGVTEGMNYVQVEGNNDTWVNGVYQSIISFFEKRAKRRSWLHAKHTYDLLLWLAGLPALFWIVFRIDRGMSVAYHSVSSVLIVALYLYVFLGGLILIRLLYNYARWVFPRYEYRGPRGNKPDKHRKIFWAILLGTCSCLLFDVGRYLVKQVL